MKTALTISGSDSSGGAGAQADLKTFSVLGVYGMSAITAITAQNTLGIHQRLDLEPELVRKQIDFSAGDIEVEASKSGMLANAAIVEVVEDAIKRNKLHKFVCDPVIFTRGGERLLSEDGVTALKGKLLPLATVVTPDVAEAAALSGVAAERIESGGIAVAKDVARQIIGAGARAVVIKQVVSTDDQTVDLFFDGKEFLEFAAQSHPKEKSHGSGSVFSAAITAGLANGKSLVDAIDQAKNLVTMAIQYSDGQGRGTAPVNVLAFAPKKK
jgi:hydroxymethylpyrimidine/phosphomethylpyrimidine kinase